MLVLSHLLTLFSFLARGRMVEGTVWLMVLVADEPGRRKGSAGLESDLGQCASEAGGQAARAFEVRLDFLCGNGLGENLRLRIVFPPSLIFFLSLYCLQLAAAVGEHQPLRFTRYTSVTTFLTILPTTKSIKQPSTNSSISTIISPSCHFNKPSLPRPSIAKIPFLSTE